MPLLLRQPRTSQPQGPATINWSNPASRGLISADLPQAGNLYSPYTKGAWTKNGTLSASVCPFGVSVLNAASGYWSRASLLTTTGPITVCIAFTPATITGSEGIWSVAGTNASGTPKYLLQRNGADIRLWAGGAYQVTLTGVAAIGKPLFIALSVLLNGDNFVNNVVTLSVNGKGSTSASFTNGSVGTNEYFGSGFSAPALGHYGLHWASTFYSDLARVNGLSANPWQIFTPQSRQLWLPTSGVGSHTTTGALAAQSATIAGTATHLKLHTTTGALAGQAATISGAALHPHTTSGALVAGSATIAGTAARAATGTHATSGALIASAAVIAGTAAHLKVHTTTGALAAGSATISGLAAGPIVLSVGGGGFIPQKSYRYRYKVDEKLDAIAPEVAQVIKAEAIAHIDDPKAAQVKTALASVGIDYKKAYQQIYKELVQEMRDEEEQIAIAIALMI